MKAREMYFYNKNLVLYNCVTPGVKALSKSLTIVRPEIERGIRQQGVARGKVTLPDYKGKANGTQIS